MEDDYTIVDTLINKKGQVATEMKECEGKLVIKQYSGINTDTFVIRMPDPNSQDTILRLKFSFFKLNGTRYININGDHMVDYLQFVKITSVEKLENNAIKIKNSVLGEIIIQSCTPEIFQKSLLVMQSYMKYKSRYGNTFDKIMYYLK